jgi:class 3 adenylate cyclase/tetratricopeptide (TPR) repeat protein
VTHVRYRIQPGESNVRHRADLSYAHEFMLCPSCASQIPADARFCSSCGYAVTATQAEERRVTTVLFADLVGFTALAEHRDPEAVKRLIDSCFQLLVDDITSFGGRVDKILGDGILALFGAPVAHEDDAERAVRAALRMQATLAQFVGTSGLSGSAGIRMRVGINTGEVLVGTLAGTEYTAMGDVVNIASRLQSAAPPGGILVGHTTYALTSQTIRFDPAGELDARGREQSVKAWLAVEATAPPGSRSRRGRNGPLIGRQPELAIGRAALDLVSIANRSVLLAISGENGVGKSRLADELIDYLHSSVDAAVLEGACVPYGEANVWFPIANALCRYLDLDPTLPVEQIRAVARQRAMQLLLNVDDAEVERMVDVFVHILGHPSTIDKLEAPAARASIHRAVARVLELRSQERPVVLSINDLHWADQALIGLLEHLVISLSRHPFALITAMRPGSEVVWPPHTERVTVVSLNLQPLGQLATEELAAQLLADQCADPKLLTALFERSGGNPLFLHELAALAAAGGGIRDLPNSLRALIIARLDQLTPDRRQIIENAAILGTAGAIASLQTFADELGQRFDPANLRELDDLGLLEVRGRRWEFRSDSVRDAAYQTLTKAARARRHFGVAKFMANFPAGLDDRAHHTATAAELVKEIGAVEGVSGTIAAEAVDLLTAAAERAGDNGSFRVAIRHTGRALELLPSGPAHEELRVQLQLLRAGALLDLRDFDAARADLDNALASAKQRGDVAAEGDAHRLLGSMHHAASRLDEARLELGQAVDLLRTVDRPDRLARALRARGFIELFGGSLVDAEWFFGEADTLYRLLDDQRGLAWLEQHRAWISFLSGDMALARDRLNHAADALDKLGDRSGVGWAFGLLAFVEFFERHFAEAEALAELVIREADQRGDEWAVGMMQTLLADLRLWQGDLGEAANLADQARSRFKKLNDKFGLIQATAPLLRAQIALGQAGAAQRSTEELLTLADMSVQGPFPLMAVAGAAMHRGDGATAVAIADRAIAETDELNGSAFEPHIARLVGLLQLGRIDEARIAFAELQPHELTNPFANGAGALLYATLGSPIEALGYAGEVAQAAGATYLDEVFAYVGAASAHTQLGNKPQATLSIEAAVVRALDVGDVVAIALATNAYQHLIGRPHPAFDQPTQLEAGWLTVIDNLPTAPATALQPAK